MLGLRHGQSCVTNSFERLEIISTCNLSTIEFIYHGQKTRNYTFFGDGLEVYIFFENRFEKVRTRIVFRNRIRKGHAFSSFFETDSNKS